MKLFSWMQSKFNGGHGDHKKFNAVIATNQTKKEEEFSDWPQGLLSIGTFGNTRDLREDKQEIQEKSESPEEERCFSPDFSAEEVGKLQKELRKLLLHTANQKQPPPPPSIVNADLPLDRFLNCPSSLEVDRTTSNRFSTYSDDKDEEEIDRTIRIILGRCKDVCEKKKKTIGKKYISFLVKKMFACRSGFGPAPTLRDTFQESRMEKLMRTLLTKKIHLQRTSRSPSTKKYLEDYRPTSEEENEEDSRREGSKWDKTDSEYIVLEI